MSDGQRLKQNPNIPEGINASQENPLVEFLLLLAGVLLGLVIMISLLSLLIQWTAPHLPFRWEQQLAERVGLVIQPTHTDPHLQAAETALQALGQRLTEVPVDSSGQIAAQPTEIHYQFHLIESDTANAFATLGGHIVVTTALLQQTHSENALAMVLAHEMAHVNLRHPIQALSRGLLLNMLLGVIGSQTGSLQTVTGSTGLLTLMSFNRDMERAADQQAITLLQAVYGHLYGADEFFMRMQGSRDNNPNWQVFFNTHPGLDERIERIHQHLPTNTVELTPLDPHLQRYAQG